MFTGEEFARKLDTVRGLERLARDELGASVSQLAIAWALANPAVHVAIVGTRSPGHIDDAVAAADLQLSPGMLAHIDEIVRAAKPTTEPARQRLTRT